VSLILGISCFYHDSATALIKNDEIIYASQEERFSRIKHDSSFPDRSINYILSKYNLNLSDIDHIVFYEKPFLKFERILETHIAYSPFGFKSFLHSIPIWIKDKLFQKNILFNELKKIDKNFNAKNKIKFSDHHLSHAASSFYPSPFKEAAFLTLDGVGEWTTTSYGYANETNLKFDSQIQFPHSLGLLYSSFTYYLGFKVNSGEYKMMGLAPYGEPKYTDLIFKELIDLKEDGSFKLNMKYFSYTTHLKMINKKFESLFGQRRRLPEIDKIENFHMDVASSIQKVIEIVVIKICEHIKKVTTSSNLCLSGGVALNCVANGKLLEKKIFKNIWIQPAAGDAGGALGAALAYYHLTLGNKKTNIIDKMKGSYLGPEFDDTSVEESLKKLEANFVKLNREEMLNFVSEEIKNEKAVGWFQGKMEFGPRALGSRSILADPRSDKTQKNLNLKIKFRESFRPFAPSILREHCNKYFKLNTESPYMLIVSEVKDEIRSKLTDQENLLFGIEKLNIKRSTIPAVTHVDYSARVQTVEKNTNLIFYDLINKFYEKTGCPLVVNTSFNIRGEPIVCTVEDAYNCFMGTNLDLLVINNFVLKKEDQKNTSKNDYQDKYELD
tara:strand:+ start:562 stop:2397 length:1836 start_codon:yes stop_codon:yes gene_type:complete